MNIEGQAALVTGGGSGLGAETARELARRGAKVAVLDVNEAGAQAVGEEIGGLGLRCDITDAAERRGGAGRRRRRATARRGCSSTSPASAPPSASSASDGSAAPLEDFRRVVEINLIGTYNVSRLFAAQRRGAGAARRRRRARRHRLHRLGRGLRRPGRPGGVCGVEGRRGLDDAADGARPGAARHPRRHHRAGPVHDAADEELPQAVQDSLAASVPFPRRLGHPVEFARMAASIVENAALNGEVIRLDGALRMAPR